MRAALFSFHIFCLVIVFIELLCNFVCALFVNVGFVSPRGLLYQLLLCCSNPSQQLTSSLPCFTELATHSRLSGRRNISNQNSLCGFIQLLHTLGLLGFWGSICVCVCDPVISSSNFDTRAGLLALPFNPLQPDQCVLCCGGRVSLQFAKWCSTENQEFYIINIFLIMHTDIVNANTQI